MRQTHMPYGPYEAIFKRPLDVLLSSIALVLFGPVLLVTAILVEVKIGSPILFMQERPGKIDPKTGKEKIFRLYKFRTMTEERDENGNLLSDENRLTKFGKILRSMSLDELPELFLIFHGEMSIVGPRPLLMKYLPRYSKEHRRRHEVRPGLTGLAQVNGRNSLSWKKRLDLDIEYIDHITFLGDLKIICQTVFLVWKRSGIHSAASVTMEEFLGENV